LHFLQAIERLCRRKHYGQPLALFCRLCADFGLKGRDHFCDAAGRDDVAAKLDQERSVGPREPVGRLSRDNGIPNAGLLLAQLARRARAWDSPNKAETTVNEADERRPRFITTKSLRSKIVFLTV
jgi:hypothetical protein